MPSMVDPSDGMASFQDEFLNGNIEVRRCVLDPELYLHVDQPSGDKLRMTYVRLSNRTVTAFVVVSPAEHVEGIPCFQIGVAVPTKFRRQGRAKSAMLSAMREMEHGLGRAGIAEFFIEAIVHTTNSASQRIAEQIISKTSVEVTDGHSGEPALQYFLKVQPGKM